jgi:hypothetical protein
MRVSRTALAGVAWHKSTHSGSDCVEVIVTGDTSGAAHKAGQPKLYVMRDSKNPDGDKLYFTEAEWEAFVLGVKDGEFDVIDD